MWLSAECFFGLLSVILGLHFSDALRFEAHRDPCIAKILSCDRYRKYFSLHRNKDVTMFTKIEDLNKACGEQGAYLRCMVRAENFCQQLIFLPTIQEMIKIRRFPAEICNPDSSWQTLYLKEARCLNAYSGKALLHCVNKWIGIDELNQTYTLERWCKNVKALIDCTATALQEGCGEYAGNIFKKFLKFHSVSEYNCFEFKPEDAEDNSFSSTPGYNITERIFSVLGTTVFKTDFENKTTEDDANTNFDEPKVDHLEKQISPSDSISSHSDAESQDMTTESDKFDFPVVPEYDYMHKNRTTFALYEDMKIGYMKYVGCGEADFFWVILSPLRSKYCIVTDLKSEYSDTMFKCTVRIDAPCSAEIDDEDKSKKAVVSHRKYVVTVLTPPNNRSLESMAIMNMHYLKLYPSSHVPEKKVNLWTAEANTTDSEQTESTSRKGPLEESESIEILYQRGNGSGQKRDKYTLDTPTHSDEEEYFEENENWDDHPLEEEDDIDFPEVVTNNIIYIESDEGGLISLHDHRSPIYSKSAYQPHSLFRPRIGEMPVSTDKRHLDEVGTNRKRKSNQSSIFKERTSEFQDVELVSKVGSDQQDFCSAEAPCDANSELISEFGIKPDMHIFSQTIQTFDPLKGVYKFPEKIPSSTKLNAHIDLKPFITLEVYVITPSSKILVPESTESIQTEELCEDEFVGSRHGHPPKENEFATDFTCLLREDEFLTHHFRYPPKEVTYDNVIDIKSDSRKLDPDYSSSVTSAPNSADSSINCMEPSNEYYIDTFTQPPYKYLQENSDTKVNPKDTIYPKNLKAAPSIEMEPLWEIYLTEIIRNISKILIETEKSTKWELLDEVFIALQEKAESIFNL